MDDSIDFEIYQKLINKIDNLKENPKLRELCSDSPRTHVEQINNLLETITEENSNILENIFEEIVSDNVKYIDITAVNLPITNGDYFRFLFSLACYPPYTEIVAKLGIWETVNFSYLNLDLQSIFALSIMVSEFLRCSNNWNSKNLIVYILNENVKFNQWNYFLYCTQTQFLPRAIATQFYRMLLEKFIHKDPSYVIYLNLLFNSNSQAIVSTFFTQIEDWGAFLNRIRENLQSLTYFDNMIELIGWIYSDPSIVSLFCEVPLFDLIIDAASKAKFNCMLSYAFLLQKAFRNTGLLSHLIETNASTFIECVHSILQIFNNDILADAYDSFLRSLPERCLSLLFDGDELNSINTIFEMRGINLPESFYELALKASR